MVDWSDFCLDLARRRRLVPGAQEGGATSRDAFRCFSCALECGRLHLGARSACCTLGDSSERLSGLATSRPEASDSLVVCVRSVGPWDAWLLQVALRLVRLVVFVRLVVCSELWVHRVAHFVR